MTIEEVGAILERVEKRIEEIHSVIFGNGGNGLVQQVRENKSDIKWIKKISGRLIWFFGAFLIGILTWMIRMELFGK